MVTLSQRIQRPASSWHYPQLPPPPQPPEFRQHLLHPQLHLISSHPSRALITLIPAQGPLCSFGDCCIGRQPFVKGLLRTLQVSFHKFKGPSTGSRLGFSSHSPGHKESSRKIRSGCLSHRPTPRINFPHKLLSTQTPPPPSLCPASPSSCLLAWALIRFLWVSPLPAP